MLRTDFRFDLPPELIAQRPAANRTDSRLLALDGESGTLRDLLFRDLLDLLQPQDLLIFNDTRVLPARTHARKPSGGRVEIFLDRLLTGNDVLAQIRGGKSLRPGQRLGLAAGANAQVLGRRGELFELRFSTDPLLFFQAHGEVPLPPYIERAADAHDIERYQTVYARRLGAVAAPTAGLHFDAPLLAALAARGVAQAFITLHVGAGTFAPMRTEALDEHVMHSEYLEVPAQTCESVAAARAAGGRVIAVGTTVVRALESASTGGTLQPFTGLTQMFIFPGYQFRSVDAVLTNFHLPESTLLMLCAAFVGRDRLLHAYHHAVEMRYRFFSYGDAMFMTCAPEAHAG